MSIKKTEESTKTAKKPDPLKKIKTLAYRAAIGDPHGNPTYENFVKIARTYLAIQNRVLFKDPIWEQYTDVEILIEYFAHLFVNDPKKRAEFELELEAKNSKYDDFLAFADAAIEENQKELEDKARDLPDKVEFSPDIETIGDE